MTPASGLSSTHPLTASKAHQDVSDASVAVRPSPTIPHYALWAVLAYCSMGLMFAHVWYGKLVGLSEGDMLHATWLSGTQLDPWMASFFAAGVPVAGMLLGAGYSIVRNSPFPALLAVVLAAGLSTAMSDTGQFLLAEMTGNARAGCFDWSSRECREMLDVPVGNARSIMVDGATAEDCQHLASWYEAVERRVIAQRESHVLEYVIHPSRLKARLAPQRTEVANFQASHRTAY